MYDRKILLESIRPRFPDGQLTHKQIDLFGPLLSEVSRRALPVAQAAYIMATAQHETAHFTTMEEIGRGKGRPYGKPVTLYAGHRTIQEVYYGRGYVQLTWLWNYATFSPRVDANLVTEPAKAAIPEIAARIAVTGMLKGMFTGAPLLRYVSSTRDDFVNARRVVNGTDRADHIARIAGDWRAALDRASTTTAT